MQTIQYELKSRPGISVRVPYPFATHAESLVNLAIKNPTGLAEAIPEYPCLGNIGILKRTTKLAQTHPEIPESLRLQDIVYLRVCIYGNEQKIQCPERQEAMEIDRSLIQLVRILESQ